MRSAARRAVRLGLALARRIDTGPLWWPVCAAHGHPRWTAIPLGQVGEEVAWELVLCRCQLHRWTKACGPVAAAILAAASNLHAARPAAAPSQGDDHMTDRAFGLWPDDDWHRAAGLTTASPQNLDAINRTLTPPTPEVLRRLHDALTRLGPIDPAEYYRPDTQEPAP